MSRALNTETKANQAAALLSLMSYAMTVGDEWEAISTDAEKAGLCSLAADLGRDLVDAYHAEHAERLKALKAAEASRDQLSKEKWQAEYELGSCKAQLAELRHRLGVKKPVTHINPEALEVERMASEPAAEEGRAS